MLFAFCNVEKLKLKNFLLGSWVPVWEVSAQPPGGWWGGWGRGGGQGHRGHRGQWTDWPLPRAGTGGSLCWWCLW